MHASVFIFQIDIPLVGSSGIWHHLLLQQLLTRQVTCQQMQPVIAQQLMPLSAPQLIRLMLIESNN
jgi:hypothetical protein